MTKRQLAAKFGVNCMGTPLAASGFYVRSDKGTFRHSFSEPLSVDEAWNLVDSQTVGHKVHNEYIDCADNGTAHFVR